MTVYSSAHEMWTPRRWRQFVIYFFWSLHSSWQCRREKTINLHLGRSPNSHEFRKRLEDITIGDTPKSKNRCNYERPWYCLWIGKRFLSSSRKTLPGIFQRGNLGTTVKWFGISFANNYLGIEFAESLASLLSHGRQYLSVSDRRYSSCGQDGSSVCIWYERVNAGSTWGTISVLAKLNGKVKDPCHRQLKPV